MPTDGEIIDDFSVELNCVESDYSVNVAEVDNDFVLTSCEEANHDSGHIVCSEFNHSVHVAEVDNDFVPIDCEEVYYYSGKMDSVEFDHSVNADEAELASATPVKGRLRERLAFWREIGASRWVLEVLKDGYSLPFILLPQKSFFKNHHSANEDNEFVSQEVSKLLLSGAIAEVKKEDLMVSNPLGVVRNAARKPRLIVDLRYVNKHLRSCKFKYEDIRSAADLFSKGDWFFKFDYKSGYHHVEILPEHCRFLGFSWFFMGQLRFFQFTVLPFGLSTGPYLFTKIQRALVKHWRSKGFRIFTYLDDGAGADQSLDKAVKMSALVRKDIAFSGFIANEEKSQWVPAQSGELLGFIMDLQHGIFQVPARRVEALKQLIATIIAKQFAVSARCLSRMTGSLVSMGLALGPVVRLWTRSIYSDICRADYWDKPFVMSQEGQSEVLFWKDNFDCSGYPIWSPSAKVEVLTYSDASGQGWGGFAVQFSDKVARGSWSCADSANSSTFREVKAIRLVLESYSEEVRGKEVLHRTDNKNAETVLSVGSRNKELHQEAVAVYKLCRELNIRLSVQWVSRDENTEADELSRIDDPNDYMLDPACFNYIDVSWGPHTVDRFASVQTKQLARYCSRYRNPGCEAVDAFTVSWSKENNWIFPPPYLIPRILKHMSAGYEDGTLLVPRWPSAIWWPLLVDTNGSWRAFVTNSMTFDPYEGIFLSGSAASNIFTTSIPSFQILALRIRFNA